MRLFDSFFLDCEKYVQKYKQQSKKVKRTLSEKKIKKLID